MGNDPFAYDVDQAVARLMKYLAIEGVTGQEKMIGQAVADDLAAAGVPRSAIGFDDANTRIPLPTETGNLIVQLPGTVSGPRLLFMTHLDTVPLCAGAQPVRKGNRIVAAGATALGGDNRTGVATLVTLAATLVERKLPHPPLTFLFTVREESGLWGARFVKPADLGNPGMAFNVDGRTAAEITVGAVGAERWEAEFLGKASHAGVHPEQGISATAAASIAIADVYRSGWFGKVKRGGKEGTSNVGVFGGTNGGAAGDATNVVTDYVLLRGECRSHDPRFVKQITAAYKKALKAAAARVTDDKGKAAKLRFNAWLEYYPFRLKATAPVVKAAFAAAERAGLKPRERVTNGGLDANWMVRHGIPTITIGAGQNGIHAIGEFVDLAEYHNACRLALALATEEA
jgi:tripeptide aminopeptidase